MSLSPNMTAVCSKYQDDALSCVDCVAKCPAGLQAIRKLDKETCSLQPYKKIDMGPQAKKLRTLQDYLSTESSGDPVRYIMEHFGVETEKKAKTKLFNWRYMYGKDYAKISDQIREITDRLALSGYQMKNESSKPTDALIAPKTPTNSGSSEQKLSRRQEEKISQSCLESLRLELENAILTAEKDIENLTMEIAEKQQIIKDSTDKIQAIRQTLEIFKQKDKLYV